MQNSLNSFISLDKISNLNKKSKQERYYVSPKDKNKIDKLVSEKETLKL